MPKTKEAKIEFVTALLDRVKETLIERVDDCPEAWDGWELRQWIADYTQQQIPMNSFKTSNRSRYRAYCNTIRTTNLI